ncbi:MAG: DUF4058 family protein [Anaerolineales bacterium]|nr:DUF4058 family protein [Anaerolineales bacterium]
MPLNSGDCIITPLLHTRYTRASYDLQMDYSTPPIPPLPEENQRWAEARLRQSAQIPAGRPLRRGRFVFSHL